MNLTRKIFVSLGSTSLIFGLLFIYDLIGTINFWNCIEPSNTLNLSLLLL